MEFVGFGVNGRTELLAFVSVLLGPLRSLSDKPEEPLLSSQTLPWSVNEGTPVMVSAYMHGIGSQASSYHHLPLVPPIK